MIDGSRGCGWVASIKADPVWDCADPDRSLADLLRLVHDRHRRHYDNRTGGKAGKERMTRPKVLSELFGRHRRR
jgi:hypothetical protein